VHADHAVKIKSVQYAEHAVKNLNLQKHVLYNSYELHVEHAVNNF